MAKDSILCVLVCLYVLSITENIYMWISEQPCYKSLTQDEEKNLTVIFWLYKTVEMTNSSETSNSLREEIWV